MATFVRVAGLGVGLGEFFISTSAAIVQAAEVTAAVIDGPSPIVDVLVSADAVVKYAIVADPIENFLGRTSFLLTVTSDVLDRYTGVDWHSSSNPCDWEFVIGQNVVEDIVFATAGETTRIIPIAAIDSVINAVAIWDDLGDLRESPTWELRLALNSNDGKFDVYYVSYNEEGEERLHLNPRQ